VWSIAWFHVHYMFSTSFYNVRHILYKFPMHLNSLSSYLSYIEHSPQKWSYSQEMFRKNILCFISISFTIPHVPTKKANEWVMFYFILVFNELSMSLWYVQFYLLVFLFCKICESWPSLYFKCLHIFKNSNCCKKCDQLPDSMPIICFLLPFIMWDIYCTNSLCIRCLVYRFLICRICTLHEHTCMLIPESIFYSINSLFTIADHLLHNNFNISTFSRGFKKKLHPRFKVQMVHTIWTIFRVSRKNKMNSFNVANVCFYMLGGTFALPWNSYVCPKNWEHNWMNSFTAA
jgi:hypothetical protein